MRQRRNFSKGNFLRNQIINKTREREGERKKEYKSLGKDALQSPSSISWGNYTLTAWLVQLKLHKGEYNPSPFLQRGNGDGRERACRKAERVCVCLDWFIPWKWYLKKCVSCSISYGRGRKPHLPARVVLEVAWNLAELVYWFWYLFSGFFRIFYVTRSCLLQIEVNLLLSFQSVCLLFHFLASLP